MSESYNDSDLFKGLVLNFQMSAMVSMGKIMNPVTNKAERNLDEAKRAIEMTNMLFAKTKGNLDDEDEKFIEQVLTDLRLNYVNEVNKPDPTPEPETSDEVKDENKDKSEDKEKNKGNSENKKDNDVKSEDKKENKDGDKKN